MTTATMLPTQPAELRRIIRAGEYGGVTSGLANGHVQANLAVLPRDLAFDFLLFCQRNPQPCPLLEVIEAGSVEPSFTAQRNPQPCPLLEVIEAGSVEPSFTAPGADISTDVPAYRIYENGEMTAELASVADVWREDLVSFLLGCSFSFEAAMADCGIPLRHQEAGSNVPMYITKIPTRPAGMFSGPMVVSMRPIPQEQIVRAVQVTSRFPDTHGAPVHIGDPNAIGIRDIDAPEFGEAVEIRPGETPVFWACGVTPQAVALNCKPPLMITHAPGKMFITDRRDSDYAVI